jgi:hypothetical protein
MVSLSLAEAKDKLSAVVNESLEETIFWLEREIARLRAGEPSTDGPDVSGDEMAAIMDRRRKEAGLA